MPAIASCQKPGCGKTWPRDPVLEVACPTCQAPVGRRCRRPSEHRVWGGEPHPKRDILADQLGHYGPCPLGLCGLRTEPTQQGLQYIIPGCEKDQSRGPEQGSLF